MPKRVELPPGDLMTQLSELKPGESLRFDFGDKTRARLIQLWYWRERRFAMKTHGPLFRDILSRIDNGALVFERISLPAPTRRTTK